ncbi:MAG: peptidyl-prolyl cis-trans isomerase [Candidatus Brocadiia bacterium]
MARKRRRKKFSPFRMSKRFERSVIVALGVFLMVIFAVPMAGPCRRSRRGRDPRTVVARIGEEKVTYGDLDDLRRRHYLLTGRTLSDQEALHQLALLHAAEEAGIRVSDAEVEDHIRNQLLARRVRVEYVFVQASAFESSQAAREALAQLATKVNDTLGERLRDALQRYADEPRLRYGETSLVTPRRAPSALAKIASAPDIVDRVFSQKVGVCSEPLPIEEGWCVFRVTERTRGFGPDGKFYPRDESWVSVGYGASKPKSYEEILREWNLSQVELERTVREQLVLNQSPPGLPFPTGTPGDLVVASCMQFPRATVRERYRRDNTRATASYFALRTQDFREAVGELGEDELRDFYTQHMDVERTEWRPGYLQPEQVRIQYVVGRAEKLEPLLSNEELEAHYQRYGSSFTGSFEEALPQVRQQLAELELQDLMTNLSTQALVHTQETGAAPDLEALVADQVAAAYRERGVVAAKTSPLFSAREADEVVPGGDLADTLFGEQGKQFVAEGEEARPGGHHTSSVFRYRDGFFFFRLLERQPSRAVPYEQISEQTYQQLKDDLTRHKAFAKARESATDYRARVHEAAFQRLAEQLGVEPVETEEFLAAESALPGVGEAVPALHAELLAGEEGELSDVYQANGKFLLARRLEYERDRGIRIQLLAFTEEDFQGAYQPALFQLRERYEADRYAYLPEPQPVPFEEVQADIRALLASRRAMEKATEAAQAARKDLLKAEEPDVAAAAEAHGLTPYTDLTVDLAKTHATPHIGRAAGFHEAVTASDIEPGHVSRVLSSAEGRFLFVLQSRDDQSATIDAVAIRFDELAKTVEIEDPEARHYYDAHRETAYVTGDEIEDAPPWEDLPEAARQRVRQEMQEEWAQVPPRERFARLRNSLVLEAFRTVPQDEPLTVKRTFADLQVLRVPDLDADEPTGVFADNPALLQAVQKLQPLQVSEPVPLDDGAALAMVVERKPDERLEVDYVKLGLDRFRVENEQPTEANIEQTYEARQDAYRVPPRVRAELLAVSYQLLDQDAEKARDQARQLLEQAAAALRQQGEEADLEAYADQHSPLQFAPVPPFDRDTERFRIVGSAPELADKAFEAQDGALAGPVFGDRGACILRRLELLPGRQRPLDEVRQEVKSDWRDARAVDRALEAAGRLRQRIATALEAAADRRNAFRNAVEKQTLTAELPRPVLVSAPQTLYPQGAGRDKPSSFEELGEQPELNRAVFRLRPGHLCPVVQAPDRTACYVAALVRLIPPQEPSLADLRATRDRLVEMSAGPAYLSWSQHVRSLIGPPR